MIFIQKCWLRSPENPKIDLLHETGLPWYAIAMLWWFLITILVRNVRPLYVLGISLVLGLIVGYSDNIDSFLALRRTIVFFPFFYIGYATDIEKINEFAGKIYIKTAAAVSILASMLVTILCYNKLSFWRNLFRGISAYDGISDELNPMYGFMWRMVAYIISIVLTFAIIALAPGKGKYISLLGKKTLSVYVFHNTLLAILFAKVPPLVEWINGGEWGVRYIIVAVIILLITSSPVFDIPVKKIITIPIREDNARK